MLAAVVPNSPTGLLNYVQTGGVVALLLVIMYGGIKKWWVFGWYYNEAKERLNRQQQELDNWKQLALQSQNLADSLQLLAKNKIIP